MITFEEVSCLLSYNPQSGLLVWKVSLGSSKQGKVAGSMGSNGYVQIMIRRKCYQAHILAWLLTYGSFPEGELDHKNREKTDNRLENLRIITRSGNNKNQGIRSDNTSGHKGVCWCKRSKLWKAQITKDKKKIYLGTYVYIEDAVLAYERASLELFPEINGGL